MRRIMKKIVLKPWQLYAGTFVLLFVLNVFIRWRDPRGVAWADNLLQSLLMTIALTIGFAVGDRYRRKNEKHQQEIMKRLKEMR